MEDKVFKTSVFKTSVPQSIEDTLPDTDVVRFKTCNIELQFTCADTGHKLVYEPKGIAKLYSNNRYESRTFYQSTRVTIEMARNLSNEELGSILRRRLDDMQKDIENFEHVPKKKIRLWKKS